MNNKINHYVEEIWTELDYEKGLSERRIILPIVSIESYKPLPWVRKYKFFDIDKENNKRNITSTIISKNYDPLYFMDNQNNMINSPKINLEIAHYIEETWMEIEYFPRKISEREIVLPIKNRENYKPTPWVKKYKFIDYLKINIDGKVIIDKTPINETITYINPIFDTSHLKNKLLLDKTSYETNHKNNQYSSKTRTLTNKNYIESSRRAVSN